MHEQRGLVVAGEAAAASTRSVYTIQQCTVLPSAPSLLNRYCECFQRCQVVVVVGGGGSGGGGGGGGGGSGGVC